MVRGKATNNQSKSKAQSEKKSVSATLAKNGSVSSPQQKVTSKSKQPPGISSCCGCGIIITEDTKALQRDRCCSNDSWKCADCLNINGQMYDQPMSDGSPNLRWFCDSCKKVITEGSQRTSTQQNDKLDNLILLTEKLMEKYENVEKKLEDKASVDMAKHLDKRMH